MIFQLFVGFIFFTLNGYGQLVKLKGSWINSKQEYIVINDTTNNSNLLCNKDLRDNHLHLKLYADTLSFQVRYVSEVDNYQTQHIGNRYDLKILKLTDSILIVKVASKLSQDFFKSPDTLEFIKQQFSIDTAFRFEKLIFHTTPCYGSCPILHIQIDSLGQMLYNGITYPNYLSPNYSITSVDGNFKGSISKEDYNKLILLLKTCNLKTLKFNSQNCCDGSLITLIVYYNGQRKYIQSMFLPPVLNDLISFLWGINKRAFLVKIPDKIELER